VIQVILGLFLRFAPEGMAALKLQADEVAPLRLCR
jgi:hypothetical protein